MFYWNSGAHLKKILYKYSNTVSITENVALNKPAWQQHPHSNYPHMGAYLAVDGRYSDLDFYARQCVHSDFSRSTAEWRVDLDGVHSIHHIFIFYWGMVLNIS